MAPIPPAALNDPQAIRHAGPDLLSLALIDSRNRLLQLLALDESPANLQRAALAGWFQEHWISCHVQRQRGEACDAQGTRLAGLESRAQGWMLGTTAVAAEALRPYLQNTLETTLDLLATVPAPAPAPVGVPAGDQNTGPVVAAQALQDDAALYFYRLALQHEDRLCESLAQALGIKALPARPQRPALWMPGQRWQLGSVLGGLVPWTERWAHTVVVPEFEIDAQPVNWAQYLEFVEDGGYDRTALWSEAGWAWLQQQAAAGQARRAPRDVEQVRGGVLVQRRQAGKLALQKVAAGQAVTQVNRYEAQAWCTWAGRRLPTEPEWELAVCTAASRGFVWGDVLEWVAAAARPWPGAGPLPPGGLEAALGEPLHHAVPSAAALLGQSSAGPAGPANSGVLRGASMLARARWRHPKARRFALASDDTGPIGFRSCAL